MNGMRLIFVTCLLVSEFCFGMDIDGTSKNTSGTQGNDRNRTKLNNSDMDTSKKMVKLEVSKNDRKGKAVLNRDIMIHGIAPHATISTQLNISATCRDVRGKIKIQKLEELEDLRRSAPFTNPVGLRFYQFRKEEFREFVPVWRYNFDYTKMVFALADIDEKNPNLVKTVFLEGFVPDNRFGLHHQYAQGLVNRAIGTPGNEKFAKALIVANPHGFAGGSDLGRQNMGILPYGEVCYLIDTLNGVNTAPYIALCRKQPSKSPALFRPSEKDHCIIL